MKKPNFQFIALLIVVTLITLFIRIPLPSKGYFNFGDVAVVFAGLLLGKTATSKPFILGFLAGGLGSALADLIGGFAIFAPITFVAKGLEGSFSALASKRKLPLQFTLLVIGGILMVAGYFVGEVLTPGIGYQLATPEILPNSIQAIGGIIGGRLTYEAYTRIIGGDSDE